jgi:hypothetical protein
MPDSDLPPNVLKRGQRVAVFPYPYASGATLGHHGMLVGVIRSSIYLNLHTPDAWQYRVLVGNCEILARGGDILPIGLPEELPNGFPDEESSSLTDLFAVRFEAAEPPNHETFRGTITLNDRLWGCFRFRKSVQRGPTYQFRLPTEHSPSSIAVLDYVVPDIEVLDREYVVSAIREIVG